MTELEKMLAGAPYDATDPELTALRRAARVKTRAFNAHPPDDPKGQVARLRDLVAAAGRRTWIEPPFYCDYGIHIHLGDRVYMNFNCVILDCSHVRVGNGTMFGPGVQILAATHPLDPDERARGPELAKPVTIGENVCIGAGALIGPGVTIGDGTTIGAGSVVMKDVPGRVLAAGNPCAILRYL